MPERRGFQLRSLRDQLILLVLGAATVLLTLLLIDGLWDRQRELEYARQETIYLTALSLRDLETDLAAAEQLLTVLSDLSEVKSPTLPACGQRLTQLVSRYQNYVIFGVAAPDGRVTCASRPIPPGANASDRSWFRDARTHNRFSVGTFERGVVSGRPVMTMGLPVIRADGTLAGVVFASLPLPLFGRLQQTLQLPPGAVLTIFDRKGTVLARFPDGGGYVGRKLPDAQITRQILERHVGTAEFEGLDGTRRLYSFTPLPTDGNADLYATAGIDTRVVYARANATLRLHLIGVLLLTVALLALAVRVGRERILNPIDALRTTARRLERGDLRARAKLSGAPLELQHLGVSFNHMAEAVEELTSNLERRVQERTAELHSSNEALETFAHSIAHDLRAPLSTIHGFTSSVLKASRTLTDAEQSDLRRVLETTERMDDLIRDLLTFSQLAQADVTISSVDLNDSVNAVTTQLQPEFQRAGARVDVQSDLPRVRANETVLRQVLLNLLGNAVKFTRPGVPPVVRVWAEREGDWVRVIVEDQGIGIREADQQRVFKVFERLHLSGAYPGTGIGLAIVRQGVERMGGQAGVESTLGLGSRFFFTVRADGTDDQHG